MIPVKGVMTPRVISFQEDPPLEEIAERLSESRIRSPPVFHQPTTASSWR